MNNPHIITRFKQIFFVRKGFSFYPSELLNDDKVKRKTERFLKLPSTKVLGPENNYKDAS